MRQNAFLLAILQLCLSLQCLAAPIAESADQDNAWEYGTSHGILGLAVLILDIIIFTEVLKSDRAPCSKLIWCLVVFLFPIVGMLIYWIFSNRIDHNSVSGYQGVA